LEILKHQKQRALVAGFDTQLTEDAECLRFDRFRIRQRGRATETPDSQKMEKDGAIRVRIHPHLLQTQANLLNDGVRQIRFNNPAIATQ
jgi:hypothetical protein